MSVKAFSAGLQKSVLVLWDRYPQKKAALIPAMHLIQAEREGWFAPETIADTAELFQVSDAHIRGIIGFYDMFHDAPVGKHIVRLCKTLSCKLRGADELRSHIREKYGVGHGETTKDGSFTFRCFECLGHCSTAPMMLVDEERYENLTVESLDSVLGGLEA